MVMSLACGGELAARGTGHRQLCGHFLSRRSGARLSPQQPGALVISYDRLWRELWTRRFADPLSDAETFQHRGAGELLEIGGRTQTSRTSRANTWDC